MKQDFIVALGGSIVCPDEVNVNFVKEFREFLLKQISRGRRFVVVIGGGGIARRYQKAAGEILDVSDEDKDWIGIHATRLNAHLMRTIFRQEAHPVIFEQQGKMNDFEGYSLVFGAGWRPGWSTDYVTVSIAADFGARRAIILGKPEYVYDKDNQKHSDARPIKELSWSDYMKLIPAEWTPGVHAPVDPVAARLAQKEKIEVVVAGGKDINNFEKILDGGEFRGTVIR